MLIAAPVLKSVTTIARLFSERVNSVLEIAVVFLPLSLTLVYFRTMLLVPGSSLTTFFRLRFVNDETICVSSSFLSKSNAETSAPFKAVVSSAFGSAGGVVGGGCWLCGLHDETAKAANNTVMRGNRNLVLLEEEFIVGLRVDEVRALWDQGFGDGLKLFAGDRRSVRR